MITMFPFFDFDNKFQFATGESLDSENSAPQTSEFAELLAGICPALKTEISPEKIIVEEKDWHASEKAAVEQSGVPAFEGSQNVAFDSFDRPAEIPEISAQSNFASVLAEQSEVLKLTTPDKTPQPPPKENTQKFETFRLTAKPPIPDFDSLNKQTEMPETAARNKFEPILKIPDANDLTTSGKIPVPIEETVQSFETISLIQNSSISTPVLPDKQPEMPGASSQNKFDAIFQKPDPVKSQAPEHFRQPSKVESVRQVETIPAIKNPPFLNLASHVKELVMPEAAAALNNLASVFVERADLKSTTPGKAPQLPNEENVKVFETLRLEQNPPNAKQDFQILNSPLKENNFPIFTSPSFPEPESQFIAPLIAPPKTFKDNSPVLENNFQFLKNSSQILEDDSQVVTADQKTLPQIEVDFSKLNKTQKTFVAARPDFEYSGEIVLPETVETVDSATILSKNDAKIDSIKTNEPHLTPQREQTNETVTKPEVFAQPQPQVSIDAVSLDVIADKQISAAPPIENQKEKSENIARSEVNSSQIKVELPPKINKASISRFAPEAFSTFESQPVRQIAANFQTNYKNIVGWLKTSVTRESLPKTENGATQIPTGKITELPDLNAYSKITESPEPNTDSVKIIEPQAADINEIAEKNLSDKKIAENFSDAKKPAESFVNSQTVPIKPESDSKKTLFQPPVKLKTVTVKPIVETRNAFFSNQKFSPVQPREEINLFENPKLPVLEKSAAKPLAQPIKAEITPEAEISTQRIAFKPDQTIEISSDKSPDLNLKPESFNSFSKSFASISRNDSAVVKNFKNTIPVLNRLKAEIRNFPPATAETIENTDSSVENKTEIKPLFISTIPQTEQQTAVNDELGDKKPADVLGSAPKPEPAKKLKVEDDLNRQNSSMPRETMTEKPSVKNVRESTPARFEEIPAVRPQIVQPSNSTIKETAIEHEPVKTHPSFHRENTNTAEAQIENLNPQETKTRLTAEADHAEILETPQTEPQIVVSSQPDGKEADNAPDSFAERALPKKSKAGVVDLNPENSAVPREAMADKFNVKNAPVFAAAQTKETPPVREQVVEGLIAAMEQPAVENETRKIRLRLRPEDLGGVEIQIENANPQEIKARFVTETEAARVILSENIKQLNETLQAAGWNVERLEIVCRDSSNSASGERQNRPRAEEASDENVFRQRSETTSEPEAQPDKLLSVRA